MIEVNFLVPPDIIERMLEILRQMRVQRVLGCMKLRIEGESIHLKGEENE